MLAVLVLYWSRCRHRLGALRSDAMAVEKTVPLAMRARGERVARFNATYPKIASADCPACARATSNAGYLLLPFGVGDGD